MKKQWEKERIVAQEKRQELERERVRASYSFLNGAFIRGREFMYCTYSEVTFSVRATEG